LQNAIIYIANNKKAQRGLMTKEEFKQSRIALRLSQRKLAKVLGRNVRTIQRYEYGDWTVSVEIANKMQVLVKALQEIKEIEDGQR